MMRFAGPSIALASLALAALFPSAPAVGAPAVPGTWTELAGGGHGAYRWSVEARRAPQTAGREAGAGGRLCLRTVTLWRSGPLELHRSRYRECARSAGLRPTDPPLIATGSQPSTGVAPRISAVGMLFAPAARRVRVTFAAGRRLTVPLARLAPGDSSAALGRFAYAAFAVDGEWCAERIVSIGAGGRVLWDSGDDDYECGSGGEPQFAGG